MQQIMHNACCASGLFRNYRMKAHGKMLTDTIEQVIIPSVSGNHTHAASLYLEASFANAMADHPSCVAQEMT